jgi:hypothetical protein
MPENIKRDFNRLFIVLTVVWLVYCAILPILERSKFFDNFLSQYAQEKANCTDAYCSQAVEKSESRMWEENPLRKWYSDLWPYMLVLGICAPPVVYGSLRGIAATAFWIWRGYKQV